jgi:hypothetical protein
MAAAPAEAHTHAHAGRRRVLARPAANCESVRRRRRMANCGTTQEEGSSARRQPATNCSPAERNTMVQNIVCNRS